VIEVPPRAVLVHRFDAPKGSMLMIHNLDDAAVELDLGPLDGADRPFDVLTDSEYDQPDRRFRGLRLRGFGYRWIRLNRSNAA
jgi:maltose alpha-D-glucosyltransferase/alpha-amylase